MMKGSAIWECAHAGGHLASPGELTEALLQGATGSAGGTTWLHTADEVQYDYDLILSWSVASSFTFAYTTGHNAVSVSDCATPRAFRCAGYNYPSGTFPVTVENEWATPTGSGYKSETADWGMPGTAGAPVVWAGVEEACFARGGHLAMSTELGEMIQLGLPNGSGTNLWTGDAVQYDSATTSYGTSAVSWSGLDPSHFYGHTGGAGSTLGWAPKGGMHPYRCVYYPIDTGYAGPPDASCNGGCFAVPLPGGSGAKMWFDAAHRPAPPAGGNRALGAVDTCRKVGGHLPLERDLAEAIRHGLPNGVAGTTLLTRDWEAYSPMGVFNGLLLGVVAGTGPDPSFTDAPPVVAWAWPNTSSTPRPFRCMWTNELR
jgi:hypothetical protein